MQHLETQRLKTSNCKEKCTKASKISNQTFQKLNATTTTTTANGEIKIKS